MRSSFAGCDAWVSNSVGKQGVRELWWHPPSGRTTIIPHHAGRDIRAKTLAKILKDLDLTFRDLEGRR